MKKELQLKEIEPLSSTKRHWSYELYIFQNKTNKKPNFQINFYDKYIWSYYTMDFYLFDPEQIFKYKSSFKYLTERKLSYNSLQDARLNYHSNIKNDSLVYTTTPNWVNFEGKFSFDYNCKNGDCLYKGPFVQESLEHLIKVTYPNEPFNLQHTGGSMALGEYGTFSYSYIVNCNKTLADKFNLYPITEKYTSYSSFEVTTYWKENE
jgi:hypothetical protein